ncbi:MAG TPA: aspartyl protease family protein [Candidatus Binatia bacterium]|jgi:clan AA aspartic protease (TIGR02281 family)
MKRLCGLFVIMIAALFLSAGASRAAEIIRWMDEKGVVHFTDSLKNVPQKFRATATRIPTGSRPLPAPTSADKASVKFHKQGELMVVQAMLNEKAAAKFVVDTGASYTTISQATAKQLELNLDNASGVIALQTANGVIEAPLVNVGSLDLGGLGLKDLKVAVHDVFPDPGIAGLLGLNFLSQFRVEIDNKNGVIYLEKK